MSKQLTVRRETDVLNAPALSREALIYIKSVRGEPVEPPTNGGPANTVVAVHPSTSLS